MSHKIILANRWLHAFLVSLFLGAGFMMVTLFHPDQGSYRRALFCSSSPS